MKYHYKVVIERFAEKQLKKLPRYILEALMTWKTSVEFLGLPKVREVSGYHDEPLKGARKGQRSIRLNRSYRAIYEEISTEEVILVGIIEVNKHEY